MFISVENKDKISLNSQTLKLRIPKNKLATQAKRTTEKAKSMELIDKKQNLQMDSLTKSNNTPLDSISSKKIAQIDSSKLTFEDYKKYISEFDEKYKDYLQLRLEIEAKQKLFHNSGALWQQANEHEKEELNKQIVALYAEHKQVLHFINFI
jgi:hypothetical protein